MNPSGTSLSARRRIARSLPAWLGCVVLAASAQAENWAPNLTTAATWHDNVTNAEATADQIDSLQLSADILASNKYPFGRYDALQLTAHFAGEWWPRYDDLLGGAVGARAAWLHTFGTDKFAPILSAEIGGDWFESREAGRRGTDAMLVVALRKRFNDRWRAAVVQQFDRRYARAAVFDQEAAETVVELAHDFSPTTRITVGGLYRTGDIVTYSGTPRGEVAAIASAERDLNTFGRPMIAYSVDAQTWGARVAIARALDASSAIVASYTWRSTEKSPVQFMNQRLAVALVTQF